MSGELFEAAWHRWDRAEQHRQRLPGLWNDYIADHPYGFALDHQGQGVYILRVWQNYPMPPDFAITAGEWLYNLRALLDYVIWATAVYVTGEHPPPNEGSLQYPIYDSQSAWDRNLYRLSFLSPHHQARLLEMQPFMSDPDANYLGWINRLARIDRHRRLVDSTAYLAEIKPVFQVPDGTTLEVEWGERRLVDGHADVMRVTVSPWEDGMQFACNPRLGLDPDIGEWGDSQFWGPMPFGERLTLMQVFVASEIAIYEYDCTGDTRKQDLLTPSFRAECDELRRRKPIVKGARTPVQWTTAGAGRTSSQAALRGEGFPRGPSNPQRDASG